MKEEDYSTLENAIRYKLIHSDEMSKVEAETLSRQLTWLEARHKQRVNVDRPQA